MTLRVIFCASHPAHVHLFKETIKELKKEGHVPLVAARDRGITTNLLETYDIDYEIVWKDGKSIFKHAVELARCEYNLLSLVRRFSPDIIVSRFNPAAAHISFIYDIPNIILDDTEKKSVLLKRMVYPISDRVYTPSCFNQDIGDNQIRYEGFHELAYLHPNRFSPDPSVLQEVGLKEDEQFVILRLVGWDALHDVGDSGIDDIVDVVRRLEETETHVLITSEAPLPDRVEKNRLMVDPHRIHHLLFYADLYIGESATMATESAVLGTPSVYISSSRRCYTDELEEQYGLVFNFSKENRHNEGLSKAVTILENNDSDKWKHYRERMLNDKTDTTEILISAIRELTRQNRP